MAVPKPNSPEALRAAQKVRNIFYMIAAANIVVIAIVLWPRPPLPTRAEGGAAAAPERNSRIGEMEAIHNRLLTAYHGRDAERFAEVFSSAADPAPNEEYFRKIVIGGYDEEFGAIQEKTLAAGTKAEPAGGVLVYDFTSKKGVRGKSWTTFREEDGKLRVLQWRLEKRE
jgi:hypothetical protein